MSALADAFAKYGEEGQSFQDWLQAELEIQLDIIRESTSRVHHVIGPLELALKIAQTLEALQAEG